VRENANLLRKNANQKQKQMNVQEIVRQNNSELLKPVVRLQVLLEG
jgi:hypothetical protein